MGFLAFINVYCLRVNLNVALVAMVDTEYIKQVNAEHSINRTEVNFTSAEDKEPECESTSDNVTLSDEEVSFHTSSLNSYLW
jgi:hypothetical protein